MTLNGLTWSRYVLFKVGKSATKIMLPYIWREMNLDDAKDAGDVWDDVFLVWFSSLEDEAPQKIRKIALSNPPPLSGPVKRCTPI